MKARIKFQKYGAMKFIGHLDIMRYFQKAFRRAEIDNEYSKGFSPHQIMSFAAPLGLGLTSDAEYLDVSLLTCDRPEVMVDRMNSVMTEGIRIIHFHPLLGQESNSKVVTAMSLVASADYLVSLKDGYFISDQITSQEEFEQAFTEFYNRQEIVINKKTKSSEMNVDIKPMISHIAFREEEFRSGLSNTVAYPKSVSFEGAESVADVYENGMRIYMQIDTGSVTNLKPELVLEAFYEELGLEFNKYAWQVHRLEVYTRLPETGKLAALNQVER